MKDKVDAADFVRHVRESAQQYSQDLLQENERLIGMVSSLHEQIAQIEATNRAFAARSVEVEQLNATLANLYVASYRIHGSLEREEVLSTLQEILINLIGTEEFAVFEREGQSPAMKPVTSFGVEAARIKPFRLDEIGLGACVARGAPYVPSQDVDSTALSLPITACVPLRIGERVVGAIVVYRLLSHKPTLEDADLELFTLLASHAATALYCSDLHARARIEARA